MNTKIGDYGDLDIGDELSLDGENRVLKATVSYLRQELGKFKKRPLLVCEAKKIINDKVMIKLANGNHFLVDVLEGVLDKIKINDLVLVEQRSLTVVDKLDRAKKHNVESFITIEKPKVTWKDLGGLNEQIREIKEVIELPLKKPEVFKNVGIQPPKGILLYGPSGTGKTLLAKAVANSTNATFIEVIGSELNQKFIGEGAKLVKDLFQLAKEKAPSIIFVDEMDALAAERMDIGTSGEREVQRTFMQFLAEMDGFKNLGDVKIIGATNRLDILDVALLRPGRLDRLIEVPIPGDKEREDIFKIHTKDMNLDNVDVNRFIKETKGFSGAEIKAVCTEAGYFAIRNRRSKVNEKDFLKAIDKLKEEEDLSHIDMFG